MRIRTKLLIFFLPLMLLSVGVMTLFSRKAVQAVVSQEVAKRGRVATAGLAQAPEMVSGFRAGGERLLLPSLQLLLNNTGGVYAIALDPAGRVLAHTNVAEKGKRYDDPTTVRAMTSNGQESQQVEAGGQPILDVSCPVWEVRQATREEEFLLTGQKEAGAGARLGTLRLGLPLKETLETGERISQQVFWIITLVSVLALGATLLFTRRTLSPIRLLAEAAERIGRGEMGQTIPVLSADEIGDLANSFNRMSRDLAETTVSKDFLQQIISSAGEGVVVYDRGLRYVMWNRFMEGLTGMLAERVVGQYAIDLFPHLREQGVYALLERALAGEVVSSDDVPYHVPQTGRSGWVLGTYGPHRNADGEVIGVIGVVRDVAERRRVEEALRESREHSRQIIETANEAFIEIDEDGLITDWNRMAEVTFGWTREEAVGRSMAELIIPPQYREAHHRGLRHFLATGEGPVLNRRIELTALYRGEHEFPVELTIWPTRRGQAYRFNAFVLDITERKRAEEALRESNRRLEEALAELRQAQQQVIQQERLRALGQMASGIAHDFNNALSPILGFSELLLTIPEVLDDREKATRYLEMIHTAAQDAASVVSRLREFYRHREKGEFFQPVHLNRLVEQSISLTQPRWKDQAQAEGKTIDIRADLKPVPFVAGNEAELREVLTNLIFNAVDAMPEGGRITITTRQETDQDETEKRRNGETEKKRVGEWRSGRVGDSPAPPLPRSPIPGWVVVRVADTGTGMTEEVRQRCLEPFFSTKGDRGTGLGLAMVFGTVQRHEGEIDIETEPGRGTTFILRLPAIRERGGEEGRRQDEGLSRPLRVLVVDDDPTVRELVIAYLAIDGHTVDAATSGREGLEKFQTGRYDLVVTDRAMPEMGGDQMAAAVKRLAPHKPVIMLTGFGDMMQAADEHPAGVDVVLSKPVTRSKLREALAQVQ